MAYTPEFYQGEILKYSGNQSNIGHWTKDRRKLFLVKRIEADRQELRALQEEEIDTYYGNKK